MKTKPSQYLLDECVPLTGTKCIDNFTSDYELSINQVGVGAKDKTVLRYAIRNNQTLVTGDKRLALRAILKNQTIVFQHASGQRYLIKVNSEKLPMKNYDIITKYLLEQNEIIIP